MDTPKSSKKQEDDFFARQEFERRQRALEDQRAKMQEEEMARQKELHYMRCPKCGSEMVEIEYEDIKLDKCSHCLGLYFDNGELDQLLDKKGGFMTKLVNVFKD